MIAQRRAGEQLRYSKEAAVSPIPSGKLPAELLRALLHAGGPLPADVLVGPAIGEDGCALDLGDGRSVLIVATDPITFSSRRSGRLAVLVNANDVAVMGARPRWFLAVLLLPPGLAEAEVAGMFTDMRATLAGFGASLVGGHTEITPAVNQPVIVGQMLGTTTRDRVIRTGGVRPGDVVIQVGAAPVEGAAVLAAEAGDRLSAVAPTVVAEARGAIDEPGISVVEAALAAADLGATALHDPTEGGLAGGLHELAGASAVRLEVDRQAAQWYPPGMAVCRAVEADPWATLASGALLAAFSATRAAAALAAFRDRGWPAAALAVAVDGTGVWDTESEAIPYPARDEVARVLEASGAAPAPARRPG
jgi:hydrogenase maturation factor